MSVSNKLLKAAAEASSSSPMSSKHGAILVSGGKVVAVGANSRRTYARGEVVCSVSFKIWVFSLNLSFCVEYGHLLA